MINENNISEHFLSIYIENYFVSNIEIKNVIFNLYVKKIIEEKVSAQLLQMTHLINNRKDILQERTESDNIFVIMNRAQVQ